MASSSPKPASPSTDAADDVETNRKRKTSAVDVQRRKIDKLMANPDKPVNFPRPSYLRPQRDPNVTADFCYNVMGSSAGAGSGEFHVYRQIRRKETLRQKVLDERQTKRELDEAHVLKRTEMEEAEKARQERNAKRNQKKKAKKKLSRAKAKQKDDNSGEDDGDQQLPDEEGHQESELSVKTIEVAENETNDKKDDLRTAGVV